MYKIVDGVSTDIALLQLDVKQHEDGVTIKPVKREDLLKCVKWVKKCALTPRITLEGESNTPSPDSGVSSGSPSVLSTCILAMKPLSAWTMEYWDFVQRRLMFACPSLVLPGCADPQCTRGPAPERLVGE